MSGLIILGVWNLELHLLLKYSHDIKGDASNMWLCDFDYLSPLSEKIPKAIQCQEIVNKFLTSIFPLSVLRRLFSSADEQNQDLEYIQANIQQQLNECHCMKTRAMHSHKYNVQLLCVNFLPTCLLNYYFFTETEGGKEKFQTTETYWWFPISLVEQSFLPLHPRLGDAQRLAQACRSHFSICQNILSLSSEPIKEFSIAMKDIKLYKTVQRETIWLCLDSTGQIPYPRPPNGRIPHFMACRAASDRLSRCPEFRRAKIVKVNPSLSQQPVRFACLKFGKMLLMPSPSLEMTEFLFKLHDIPANKWKYASSKRGALKMGVPFSITPDTASDRGDKPSKIDMVVVGSLAVCPLTGNRLGKGEGWADVEWALLFQMGLVSESTVVVTTVHDLQVVYGMPEWFDQEHDVPVDLIVTPTRTIRILSKNKKSFIFPQALLESKASSSPFLRNYLSQAK